MNEQSPLHTDPPILFLQLVILTSPSNEPGLLGSTHRHTFTIDDEDEDEDTDELLGIEDDEDGKELLDDGRDELLDGCELLGIDDDGNELLDGIDDEDDGNDDDDGNDELLDGIEDDGIELLLEDDELLEDELGIMQQHSILIGKGMIYHFLLGGYSGGASSGGQGFSVGDCSIGSNEPSGGHSNSCCIASHCPSIGFHSTRTFHPASPYGHPYMLYTL